MLSSFFALTARVTTRSAPAMVARRAPAVVQAVTARRPFHSEKPFAVDAPDGDHDLQDLEESIEWTRRTLEVASITEDAAAINKIHDAVLGKNLFAVDAPDGEHDLEDVEEHMKGVNRIIDEASILEDAKVVREQQSLRKDCLREASKTHSVV
jgi:hypothetical protein